MCGIVGVRKSFRPERADAQRALDALRWRGPDGARLIEVGAWWLGVARLAITDPANDQPIVCPRTGRAVALNGAITSAPDDWQRFGARARTRNDAELLLLRFEEDGVERLDVTGPYAFAIVDARDEAVWLARDPEGEKPLCVALDEAGHVLAFASTYAALRALGCDVRLADGDVARFLRFGFCDRRESGREGALRVLDLPLGLHVDHTRGLAGSGISAAASRRSGAPIAAALRAAVGRCGHAEVPIGLALSGGVDSACIAACLRADGRTALAYQARASGEPGDERARAEAVAAHCGLTFRPVDLGPEVLRSLVALTRDVGQPLGDPSVLAVHALARAAAADGVRVLLSGEGADELLLGYARHRAAARLPTHGLRWLPSPGLSTSRIARAWRALASTHPYDALLEVAPPVFRRATQRVEERGLVGDLLGDEPSIEAADGLGRARWVDRVAYLRRDLLPKLDAATMAAGVEGRCPFLDPEVTRSAEAADPDPRRSLGKRALRAAFANELPSGHFDQPKRGFALPLDRWWCEDAFLPDLLLERRTLDRPHLRADGVRRMLDLHRSGRARLGHALYLIVALEVYLRTTEDAA